MAKTTKHAASSAAKVVTEVPAAKQVAKGVFSIKYPIAVLLGVVFLVYFRSLSLGYTELDDSIFIKEFRNFNQDISNVITAFTRGLFDATRDPYYRPLFSCLMIFNYQVSGEEPGGYHFINVVLHGLSVVLFYKLAIRLGVDKLKSFWVALIFAVHPVVSQAVAWIPGRNDTLLAVFVLLFGLRVLRWYDSRKTIDILLSGLFLLLAYFTKETAVFAAPAIWILLVLYRGVSPRVLIPQYVVWVVCFVVWYMARAAATTQDSGIASAQAFTDFIHRLPVIVQYLGKVLLPFNLSVFPTQRDTVMYYGVIATLAFVAMIVISKPTKQVLASILVFFLFLSPALLVPSSLNQQTFEHRLYLPVMGLLLMLPHTIVMRNAIAPQKMTYLIGAVCIVFALINVNHQAAFADRLSFWTQAAESSPNSAYANMMLAARLDASQKDRSEELFRKAYRLNPREKYLNFYMGEMLQKKDSVMASEQYLLAEMEVSGYYMTEFYLARVAMEKGDKMGAIKWLQRFTDKDRQNPMANLNLLLLYLETQQVDKAKAQINRMRQYGVPVPPDLATRVGM